MTREEAIERFNGIINAMSISIAQSKFYPSKAELDELCDIAIEVLQADTVSREDTVTLNSPISIQAEMVAVVRKPIKGYEDYYEVDQFGRVFAKERMIHVTDHDREYDKHLPSRQMKQSVHTKGYKTVPLTKDGVCTTKFVHRIVAEAFIPNPDDLPFVNHIDEDKTNNFVENLEWCTEQYNSTYGKAREKHAKALKGRHHTEEHKKKISDSLKRFYGERREP